MKQEYRFYGIIKSKDNKHKYEALFINRETERVKHVKFGAKDYNDYIIYSEMDKKNKTHIADKKKANYIARHVVNEDWSDMMSAGYLSYMVLWNKPTLRESIDDLVATYKKTGYL